jgi:hypothetical protein
VGQFGIGINYVQSLWTLLLSPFLFSLLIRKDKRALALLLAASLPILSNSLVSPAVSGTEASFPDQPQAVLITECW